MTRVCPECLGETADTLCPVDGFVTVPRSVFRNQVEERMIGHVLDGRFRIDGVIGRGGMGVVYRGTQLNVDRPVAIKLINHARTQDIVSVQRFQQEARLIGRLKHPNIIQLIDFGAPDDEHYYLAMELVEGQSLSRVRKRGEPMDPHRVMHISEQVLAALAVAHDNDIVHRDLKPTNIMLTTVGDVHDFVKVLDFGVAWDADPTSNPRLTTAGVAVGSPMYMAPEQAAGLEITGQADIYSLGAMMYELLTGQPPFRCATNREYLAAHVHANVPNPIAGDASLRGPLVDFVMSCLEKLPRKRPLGARLALERLRLCDEDPVHVLELPPLPGAPTPRVGVPLTPPTGSGSDHTQDSTGAPIIQPTLTVRAGLEHTPASSASFEVEYATSESPQLSPVPPVDEAPPPPERGWPRWATAAAVLLLLGGAGLVAVGSPASTAPSIPAAPAPAAAVAAGTAAPGEAVAAPAEAETAPAPVELPADEVAAPRELRVTVTSDPADAEVRRDGKAIGRTPLDVTWVEGQEPPTLEVRRSGHAKATVTLAASDAAAGELPVVLKPKPRKRSAAKRKHKVRAPVKAAAKPAQPAKPKPKPAAPARPRSYTAMP